MRLANNVHLRNMTMQCGEATQDVDGDGGVLDLDAANDAIAGLDHEAGAARTTRVDDDVRSCKQVCGRLAANLGPITVR